MIRTEAGIVTYGKSVNAYASQVSSRIESELLQLLKVTN